MIHRAELAVWLVFRDFPEVADEAPKVWKLFSGFKSSLVASTCTYLLSLRCYADISRHVRSTACPCLLHFFNW